MVLGNPCERVIRPPKGCDPQVENCYFKAIMRVKEMVRKEKILGAMSLISLLPPLSETSWNVRKDLPLPQGL